MPETDKVDELRILINEWWALLSPKEQRDCPLHTKNTPASRRNLFWWIEEWLGDDLASVINGINYETGIREWVYQLTEPEYPHCMFSNASRPIALMSAAIAKVKRMKEENQP